MMSKLLLVEDDQSIVSSLSDYLGLGGYSIIKWKWLFCLFCN